MSRKNLLSTFLVGMCMVASGPSSHGQQKRVAANRINRLAPDFSRTDLNHRKVDLSAFRGKVVLLNFWATWCGPCLTEIPAFAQWQKELGPSGFQVVGVSMDDASKGVATVTNKLHVNYPVVMGDEKLGAAYGGVLGLPVTFLIDKRGRIRSRHQGGADLPHLKSEIESLLRER